MRGKQLTLFVGIYQGAIVALAGSLRKAQELSSRGAIDLSDYDYWDKWITSKDGARTHDTIEIYRCDQSLADAMNSEFDQAFVIEERYGWLEERWHLGAHTLVGGAQ